MYVLLHMFVISVSFLCAALVSVVSLRVCVAFLPFSLSTPLAWYGSDFDAVDTLFRACVLAPAGPPLKLHCLFATVPSKALGKVMSNKTHNQPHALDNNSWKRCVCFRFVRKGDVSREMSINQFLLSLGCAPILPLLLLYSEASSQT